MNRWGRRVQWTCDNAFTLQSFSFKKRKNVSGTQQTKEDNKARKKENKTEFFTGHWALERVRPRPFPPEQGGARPAGPAPTPPGPYCCGSHSSGPAPSTEQAEAPPPVTYGCLLAVGGSCAAGEYWWTTWRRSQRDLSDSSNIAMSGWPAGCHNKHTC